MIYKNLPYKEVWIKKSFLMGPDNFKWASDEYVQGQLVGVKAVQSSVPLFEVYLPEYAACYDKVLQCAIFEKPYTGDREIRLDDVAWWDCISDNIDIYSKLILKGSPVAMKTRNGENRTGTYFFTLDFKPPPPNESIDYTEAQWWSEHKQKNFFFDDETGVLCCAPNNKLRYFHYSLGTEEPKRPFFKVFEPSNEWSHESKGQFFGDTKSFDYSKENS